MSEIQVSTSDLRNGTQSLHGAAGEIEDVQSIVSRASAGVGNAYGGQLRKALEGIVGGATQTGTRLQSRAFDLGNKLLSRATGFEAANEAVISAVLGVSTSYINSVETTQSLGIFSFLKKMKETVASIWNVSGLATAGLALPIFISTKPGMPTPLPVPLAMPQNSVPTTDYNGIALRVTADDNRRTYKEKSIPDKKDNALYSRFDGKGGKSNCTWYAAVAVEEAYGIPLNSGTNEKAGTFSLSLGNGGKWADNAKAAIDSGHINHDKFKEYSPYIKSVDSHPESGSVYSIPSQNHVAFVEKAVKIIVDGNERWQLTLSEENYVHNTTGAFKGSTKVSIPNHPEVYRWIRTIDVGVKVDGSADTNGSFIHFNNPNLPQ